MGKRIGSQTRKELLEAMRRRDRDSPKMDKTRILDEFVTLTGYHRKHGVRLLRPLYDGQDTLLQDGPVRCRRVYDEAVKEALTVMWEASDRICGKRLKAILPELLAAMERHGHLNLDPEVRIKVLRVSAATIDRLLKPIRNKAKSRRKLSRPKKARKEVAVRTFADWGYPDPGNPEIDFVVHCGVSMAGSSVHTLVGTDICSGWTEFVPLLAREQSLVVEGFEVLFGQIPFPVLGVDSDNDSSFINETLLAFCRKQRLEFTRSRAYHKNDQAWVEQKNGAVRRSASDPYRSLVLSDPQPRVRLLIDEGVQRVVSLALSPTSPPRKAIRRLGPGGLSVSPAASNRRRTRVPSSSDSLTPKFSFIKDLRSMCSVWA